MSRIVTILPFIEKCGYNSSGAIALSTKVFTLYSKFKEEITVFGSDINGGYKDIKYQYIKPKQKLFGAVVDN